MHQPSAQKGQKHNIVVIIFNMLICSSQTLAIRLRNAIALLRTSKILIYHCNYNTSLTMNIFFSWSNYTLVKKKPVGYLVSDCCPCPLMSFNNLCYNFNKPLLDFTRQHTASPIFLKFGIILALSGEQIKPTRVIWDLNKTGKGQLRKANTFSLARAFSILIQRQI